MVSGFSNTETSVGVRKMEIIVVLAKSFVNNDAITKLPDNAVMGGDRNMKLLKTPKGLRDRRVDLYDETLGSDVK